MFFSCCQTSQFVVKTRALKYVTRRRPHQRRRVVSQYQPLCHGSWLSGGMFVVAVRLLCSCQEQKFLLHPESNCCSSKRFEGICKFWRSACKTIVEFEEASSLVWDVELTLVVYFEMLCLWCSCGRTSSLRRNPELFKDLAVGFMFQPWNRLYLVDTVTRSPSRLKLAIKAWRLATTLSACFLAGVFSGWWKHITSSNPRTNPRKHIASSF